MNHFCRFLPAAVLFLLPALGPPASNQTIRQIHGEASVSPWLDQQVTTEGIVTLVLPFGFWMQAPAQEDQAPWHHGLHVFTGQAAPVGEGDRVRVTGP